MIRPMVTVSIALAAIVAAAGCAKAKRPALQPSAPVPGAVLWVEPADLAKRDLFHGPWGKDAAPDPTDTYELVELKHSGVNMGMTVEDSQGREWSVKTPYPGGLDSEAPVEVALSRILSAVGYPQPPVYHLAAFRLKDGFGTRTVEGGRFRLKDSTLNDEGDWQWEENPFIGSRPYQGLLVLLMMFNSTDMKNSNNTLYTRRNGDLVEQWYAVRDIGSALGDTAFLAPRKNNITAFEKSRFIDGVTNGKVDFAYKGVYRKYVDDRVTPADVEWACRLLGRLSDRQWNDAFRAGGYEPDVAARFIRELRDRIAEGLALNATLAATNKR
ncbi:MAG: hypothetical protein AB7P34_11540 [Vicinamibacterales bacterium]